MSTQTLPLWQSIKQALTGQPARPTNDYHTQRRIRITEHEVRTLPPGTYKIRIHSGSAWVSWKGQDFVLREGETMRLRCQRHSAVVTATGRQPVVLELLG